MLLLALLAAALLQPEPAEDDAHRADRLRTRELNADVAAATERRLRENARRRAAYQDARADYLRAVERWRRQVAACRSGDHAACAGG
jgi:hypothetical protein